MKKRFESILVVIFALTMLLGGIFGIDASASIEEKSVSIEITPMVSGCSFRTVITTPFFAARDSVASIGQFPTGTSLTSGLQRFGDRIQVVGRDASGTVRSVWVNRAFLQTISCA